MMQRRMTAARIPPVITTVPAVIRPTPHPTLQRDAGTGRGQEALLELSAPLEARRVPGTGTRGLAVARASLPQGLMAQGAWRAGRTLTEGVILLPVSAQLQGFLLSFSFNSLLPCLSPLLTPCLTCTPSTTPRLQDTKKNGFCL